MTSENPASLPPMVMDTSEVEEFREPSWFAITSSVVAPEQALNANEDGLWAAFHRYGYALVLRSQEPLELM
jgi:hypothetical protein